MNLPLISVIVPIYNASSTLLAALTSIKDQNYKNLEVLLIDDGSIDDSPVICKKIQSIDNRFKYIRKENGGVSSARNLGLTLSTGSYIAFIDADDTIDPSFLSDLLSLLKSGCDVAVAGVRYYKNGNSFFDCVPYSFVTSKTDDIFASSIFSLPKAKKLNVQCGGYSCNKLYKRSIIGDTKFSITNCSGEDEEFNYLISLKQPIVGFFPAYLYNYVINTNSLSQKKNFSHLLCKSRFLLAKKNKSVKPLWDAFKTSYRWCLNKNTISNLSLIELVEFTKFSLYFLIK